MLAILKADFRRLVHSKGFWTMEILLLAFNFLIVLLLTLPSSSLSRVSKESPVLRAWSS